MTGSPQVTRSHTQLTTYAECSWRYKLKYIDHKQERPCVWLPGGIAFHSATEWFDKATWFGNEDNAGSIGHEFLTETVDAFRDAFTAELAKLRQIEPDESKWRTAGRKTKALPNGQDVTWWNENGPAMTSDYVFWRIENAERYAVAALPDGEPAVEFGGLNEAGPIPVKYFPDLLMVDVGTGALIVVDKKTGATMPTSTHQLGEYALWTEDNYGLKAHYGAHYDARKGELEQPRLIGRWTADLVDETYVNLDKGIRAGIFLPNIRRECSGCGYKTQCKYQPEYRGE